jgi:hypothetical protein
MKMGAIMIEYSVKYIIGIIGVLVASPPIIHPIWVIDE